jgi:ketoreductase
MPVIQRRQDLRIEASTLAAYRAVADISLWPAYMPAVRKAHLLQARGLEETVELEADGFGTTLTWSSSRVLDPRKREIAFTRLDPQAPIRSMKGVWTFQEDSGACRVTLIHEYSLWDLAAHDEVERAIAANVTRDLEGLKDFLESRSDRDYVIVTGASKGIGRAIAVRLARHGWGVILGARGKNGLARVAAQIRAEIPDASLLVHEIDVTSTESVESFFSFAQARVGDLYGLVNNAGIGGGGDTRQLPESHWTEVLETNLNGVYRCTKAFLRLREPQDRSAGRVVNIASTGGKQGVIHAAAYCASKHAVVGLTKSLGLEYAKTGLTFNAVCPGFVETDLAAGARERYAALQGTNVEQVRKWIEGRIPVGRYAMPEEVAGAVDYFLGRETGIVTAQTLNVCGGLGNY